MYANFMADFTFFEIQNNLDNFGITMNVFQILILKIPINIFEHIVYHVIDVWPIPCQPHCAIDS